MTVRQFDGVDDFIQIKAAGRLQELRSGPVTFVACWRSSNVAAAQGLFRMNDASLGIVYQANPFSNGNVFFNMGGQGNETQAYGPNDTWWVTAFSKGAGQSIVRSHQLNLATGVWAHVNENTTPDSLLLPDHMWFGKFNAAAEFLNGDIAGWAAYNYNMTDTQVEALGLGFRNWMGASPISFFDLTGPVASPIQDLMGNSVQTAITGTTQVAGQDPPNFNLDILADSTNDLIQSRLGARYPAAKGALHLPGTGAASLNNAPLRVIPPTGTTPFNFADRFWVAFDGAPDDWSPSGAGTLVSRWVSIFDLKGWIFQLTAAGNLAVLLSDTGNDEFTFTSTVTTGFTDGTRHAVAADIDPDNGAAGRSVSFFTATSIAQGDWVQLGATVTQAGAITVPFPTIPVVVGAHAVVGYQTLFKGKCYDFELRDGGQGGTVVARNNFAAGQLNGKSQTTSQGVGIPGWADAFNNNYFIFADAVVQPDGSEWYEGGLLTRYRADQTIPQHEQYVAHVAGASASLNFGDDANAFWDAFVP